MKKIAKITDKTKRGLRDALRRLDYFDCDLDLHYSDMKIQENEIKFKQDREKWQNAENVFRKAQEEFSAYFDFFENVRKDDINLDDPSNFPIIVKPEKESVELFLIAEKKITEYGHMLFGFDRV